MSEQVVMCDRDPSKPAAFSYAWDWGESGVCCAEQRTLLQQAAVNLNRDIQFGALQVAPPAMDRPERVNLKAQIYALEEEVAELKARGADMYRELDALRSDNRLLLIRDKQAKAELSDLAAKLAECRAEIDRLTRENSDLTEELGLLRPLVDHA